MGSRKVPLVTFLTAWDLGSMPVKMKVKVPTATPPLTLVSTTVPGPVGPLAPGTAPSRP